MAIVESFLKKTLSPRRYQHCLRVGELAAELAGHHGWDPQLAYLTGILHDCVKEWSPKKLIFYAKKYRLPVPDIEFMIKNNPNMLHGYVASHFVKKNKWLVDPSALRAIRFHTIGGMNMGVPEMIIFISDFASKDRQYDMAKVARKEAVKNLRSAFRLALSRKIRWNLKAFKPVHPFAIKVWNSIAP